MIRWHRRTEPAGGRGGAPVMIYYTDDRDWKDWTIRRIPVSNGSRTYWSEYQPEHRGESRGPQTLLLRDAKRFVERQRTPEAAK